MTSTFSKVQEIIADSLFIELDEVKMTSNLVQDLGAESIDFLDIIFRLEKTFNIKLPKGKFEKRARENLSDAEFAISGVLQPKGLERLIAIMPGINPVNLKPGFYLRDLPSLYTVETFVKMVDETLEEENIKVVDRPTGSKSSGTAHSSWLELQDA